MPTLVLRFPGGRYHATPGGHHVNEGLVEWPPSPWRLVRALIACGYSTQQWSEVPPAGRRLIEALCSVAPEYRLPRAALGHSRHYMPTGELKNGRENTTLVLDTFADVGDGELWVRWPITIDAEAQSLFARLVEHLGYLGRSESWVLGASQPDDVTLPATGLAFAHTDATRPGRDFEQIALTAPELPPRYAAWRQAAVTEAIEQLALPSGKKLTQAQKKKLDATEAPYPLDLIDALHRDTAWWQFHRWSQAPGSRQLIYWRETTALEVGPSPRHRSPTTPRIEMMLLALSTGSGSRSALPPTSRTLPQAELLHKALVSKLGFNREVPCPELIGKDASGTPLKGHVHAHVLPLDLDLDGHLDHVVVFARMGLGDAAQAAVRNLRRTYMKRGGELRVAVAGSGALSDLRGLRAGLSEGVARFIGPEAGALCWRSATPFVAPRHVKKNGRASLTGQIEEELEERGFPAAQVELLGWTPATLPLRHFIRRRRSGPQPPVDAGFALQLRFKEPVSGPICLGYGCHFGLGRFEAIAS